MYLWINRIISSSLVTTTSNPSTVHRDLCATARSPQRARLDLLAGAKCGRQGRGMCTQSGAYIYTLNRRLCYTSTFFNLSTAQDSPAGIHSPFLAVSSLLYGFVESYITSPGALIVLEVLLFVGCTHKPPLLALWPCFGVLASVGHSCSKVSAAIVPLIPIISSGLRQNGAHYVLVHECDVYSSPSSPTVRNQRIQRPISLQVIRDVRSPYPSV